MRKRIKPKKGQESVWDYPRPPRLESTPKHLKVMWKGQVLAETNGGFRVLETSHPPVYYFPPNSIRMDVLEQVTGQRSFCEFKGVANYWQTREGQKVIAWSYPEPSSAFQSIRDYLAFYPSRVEACYVDGELAVAQEGDFYGGWITKDIVGPFKGGLGTWGW